MVVLEDVIRFLLTTVHLQVHFLVRVLELRRRDQVVPLRVRLIVHGVVSPFSSRLPVDVAQRDRHHTHEHEQSHQTYAQGHGGPLEVGLWLDRLQGKRVGVIVAARPREAAGTQTHRRAAGNADARATVQAEML